MKLKFKITGDKVRWFAAICIDLLKIIYDYFPRGYGREPWEDDDNYPFR